MRAETKGPGCPAHEGPFGTIRPRTRHAEHLALLQPLTAITRSDLGERCVCSARGIRNQFRNDGSRTHQPIMEISCGNSSKFARPGLPAAPYRFQRPRVQLPEISSMLVDAERTLS